LRQEGRVNLLPLHRAPKSVGWAILTLSALVLVWGFVR
jgi:hypothetical protein